MFLHHAKSRVADCLLVNITKSNSLVRACTIAPVRVCAISMESFKVSVVSASELVDSQLVLGLHSLGADP